MATEVTQYANLYKKAQSQGAAHIVGEHFIQLHV